MSEKLVSGLVSILLAVIGVAIIAVLVSQQAQTGAVLTAGGNAFSGILKAAVSPLSSSNNSLGSLNFGGLQ